VDGAIDRRILATLWSAILRARTELGYDFVVLDLGAGTHRHTIDLFCGAHLGVITVLPEPTSIENAYMFLKTSLWRLIDNVGHRLMATDMADQIKMALASSDGQGFQVRGYADRLRGLSAVYPGFVNHLFTALAGRMIGVVVNQTRSQQDIDIGKSMELIAQRYFGLSSASLGYLNYDESAWKSLKNRRLLAVDFPQAALTRRTGEVCGKILSVLGY
jgi:flagellar biosynthesis protein FlhG